MAEVGECEIEEVDGTQMPNSQPTQFTQTTQASPSVCPSFSDLKDSDDEGYHREVQNVSRLFPTSSVLLNAGMLCLVVLSLFF